MIAFIPVPCAARCITWSAAHNFSSRQTSRLFSPICAQTDGPRGQNPKQESLLRSQYHKQQQEGRRARGVREGQRSENATGRTQRRQRPRTSPDSPSLAGAGPPARRAQDNVQSRQGRHDSKQASRRSTDGADFVASDLTRSRQASQHSRVGAAQQDENQSMRQTAAGSDDGAHGDPAAALSAKKKKKRKRRKRRNVGRAASTDIAGDGNGDQKRGRGPRESDTQSKSAMQGVGANAPSKDREVAGQNKSQNFQEIGGREGTRKAMQSTENQGETKSTTRDSLRKHSRRSEASRGRVQGDGNELKNRQQKPQVHSQRGRSPILSKILYGNDLQVRRALEELASGNILMSIHEFNDVLSTLNRQRKMRAALGLVRVSRSSAFGRHIAPLRTVKTFTIMLDIFGKARQLDQAFALFYEMQRDSNLEPTQVTYNALISSCSRNNEPELAHEVFEDMQKAGLEGDKFTYASLIDAHAKLGDVEGAFEVASRMGISGVLKDQTIYSALMEACGRARRLDRALLVFEEMKRSGVWPNLISYAVLLDCCANSREPYKAFELFADMKYWGLTSNVVTWTGLLHACAKAGWPERAEMVLQRMRDAGVEPNEITFGALVDGWTRIGNMERAFEAVRKMVVVDDVPPNSVLVGGLIEACRRHRDGRSVGTVWQLIVDHNIRPARTYYPTMVALAAWADDVDTAISISSHCYARGFLRRVTFSSRDPTLLSLAYALVCVYKACENRADRELLLGRMVPIFDSVPMGEESEIAGMTLEDAFNKVASFWETTAPVEGDVTASTRTSGKNGRHTARSARNSGPRMTVRQMKARFLYGRRRRNGPSGEGSSPRK